VQKQQGRNERCQCGSGKKYKHCHGSPEALDRLERAFGAGEAHVRAHQAAEKRRIEQQGLGKPIISAEFQDHRFVAVGNKVHFSKNWKTFTDFLIARAKQVLGQRLGNAELAKPETDMHPFSLWYRKLALLQADNNYQSGVVKSMPETGAVHAFLELAYNLYLLEHNAELRDRLVNRLTVKDQFLGALSEIRVAGMLIRAGYTLAFQDEDESSVTHCEYDATRIETGKSFSIEVKTRHWQTYPARDDNGKLAVRKHVARLTREAMKKRVTHDRIVFIELAMPDAPPAGSPDVEPWWMQSAVDGVKDVEQRMIADGQTPPPAIVVVSNHPHHLHLDATTAVVGFAVEGFGPTDFRSGAFGTIREALKFREQYRDFLTLWRSIENHRRIPTTFDGEDPHLAFGDNPPRLKVGVMYAIPGADGATVDAVLEDATVSEPEKLAYGVYRTVDGQRVIATTPLTDAELEAYRAHPDTFFGVINSVGKANSPLDMFDLFFGSYKGTSKERLLEFMAASADIAHLRNLPQEELAITYCERLVYGLMAQSPKSS